MAESISREELHELRNRIGEEHKRITEVLDKLLATGARDLIAREQAIARLQAELEAHHTIEHEALYPRLGDIASQCYVEAAESDHSRAERHVSEMRQRAPTTDSWERDLGELNRIVRSHIEKEEAVLARVDG